MTIDFIEGRRIILAHGTDADLDKFVTDVWLVAKQQPSVYEIRNRLGIVPTPGSGGD